MKYCASIPVIIYYTNVGLGGLKMPRIQALGINLMSWRMDIDE